MKPTAELTGDRPVRFSIRTITEDDIELLRVWKNAHREFFFHKAEITPEQQRAWFARFVQSDHDHMFMVVVGGKAVGCMGARLLADHVDAYNIILGEKGMGGTGLMSQAMAAMCAFMGLLYPDMPIRVKVLPNNPAITWYERNGFGPIDRMTDHIVLELRETPRGEYCCQAKLPLPIRRTHAAGHTGPTRNP